MITFFKKRKTGSLLLLAAIFLTNVNLYAEDSEKAVKTENTAKDDGKTFFEMGISKSLREFLSRSNRGLSGGLLLCGLVF